MIATKNGCANADDAKNNSADENTNKNKNKYSMMSEHCVQEVITKERKEKKRKKKDNKNNIVSTTTTVPTLAQ